LFKYFAVYILPSIKYVIITFSLLRLSDDGNKKTQFDW